MGDVVLYIATVLMWLVIIASTCRRIFHIQAWFSDVPASFTLIRPQSKKARVFLVPLSVLFIVAVCAALLLNTEFEEVRNHILAALAFYITAGLLSGFYFTREITAFSAMPADAPQTPELLRRVRKWKKWITVRDILQWLAAISLTMACSNL